MEIASRLNSVQEYYFSSKLAEIARMRESGIDVINLGIGNPDLPPPEPVIEELKKVLSYEGIHGYQSYKGIPELRSAIAGWYSSFYNVPLNPDTEILPLIGSKEGIFHISAAYVNPGDLVLVPDPGYPTYASVSELLNADVMVYDLKPEYIWQPDIKAITNQDLSRLKILWLNTPHMPTGAQMDENVLKELIILAHKHNFLIVNDNPYSFILHEKPRSIFQLEGAKDVCLELNSLSKSHHLPGWRIGWVSGQQRFIQNILRFKSNIDSGMFKAVQLAAVKALTTPFSWHQSQNKLYFRRKERVIELLELLHCEVDNSLKGMFVWAKIPPGPDNEVNFTEKLLQEKHVFVPPGSVFGKNGRNYIRVSLCVAEERIQESIDRIKRK